MKYIFGVWVDYDGNVYRRDLRYSHKPFVKVQFDKSKNEYLRVTINNKTYKVHRLIAMAFIPNPENKRTVNHKDGNKTNNHVDNLEWSTYLENNQHAINIGLRKNTLSQRSAASEIKSKLVLDTKTGIFYDNAKQASGAIGFNYRRLSAMLSGQNPNKTNFIYV